MLGRSIGGRYRVEVKLGAGGMATVYRASHDLLGRKVAIKFLSPELALDATQKERFLREARAANRIKHENIIDITDYGEEDGLVYLVMELLEGESLAHVIARGPIPPREAINYLTQTARALARAHELEVIHRDLKPENIYVIERDGHPHIKLLDFGLAHVRSEVRLTALGSIFGTPEYMSPEQARGQPVGPASDLYSLGVVFFEMLTSRLPFEGSTAELIVKHLKAAPPTVSSIVPGLPPELDAVVAKMLTKDPAKRHRDGHHLVDDLAAVLTLLAPEPGPTSIDEPGRPTRPSAQRLAAIAAEQEDEHPTTVPVSVRSWIERRTAYRRALEAVYRAGSAPPVVAQAADLMERLVDETVTIEAELANVGRHLADREAAASDSRGRIGRALDELARDESGLLRQLEDLERRTERARLRATQAAGEFTRAWTDGAARVRDGVLPSIEVAQLVETAGRKAGAWRQAMQEADETQSLLDLRRASRDDLRFQVAQLKGRLGAMNADVEHELVALRDKASGLSAQMAGTQERLAEAASIVAQNLMEFPSVRPMITANMPRPAARGR